MFPCSHCLRSKYVEVNHPNVVPSLCMCVEGAFPVPCVIGSTGSLQIPRGCVCGEGEHAWVEGRVRVVGSRDGRSPVRPGPRLCLL